MALKDIPKLKSINIQHRLVYQILEDIKTIKIISMWSHYDSNLKSSIFENII